MAMSALSVMFSVFVLNFHHRGAFTRGPPLWLRSAASCMSHILCSSVNFSPSSNAHAHGHVHPQRIYHHSYNQHLPEYDSLLTNEVQNINNLDAQQLNNIMNSSQQKPADSGEHISMDEEILKYFNAVVAGHEKALAEKRSVHDWQEIARILDKVFFWSFFVITLISSLVLLIISPMTKHIDIEDYMS